MPGSVSDMDWDAVCARFHLGQLRVPPRTVGGATSNMIWRACTNRGEFAVKQLTNNADQPWFLPSVEAACRIERQALAAGLPMPEPVPDPSTGRYLAHVNSTFVRVHGWLDGHTPSLADVDVALAATAGRLLATIHAADIPAPGEPERGPDPIPAKTWYALARQVTPVAPGLAEDLRAAAEDLEQLHARTYAADPPGDRIASHADLDPKNTLLLPDGSLAAVDWDAARTVAAPHEATQVALDWATTPDLRIDTARFPAALNAYRKSGGRPVIGGAHAFGGWVGSWIWCLDNNLSYAIHDPATRDAGCREARTALTLLGRAARSLDNCLTLLPGS